MFKILKIDIKGTIFERLLIGDDSVYLDLANNIIYYNLSQYIMGGYYLDSFIQDISKLGVECMVTMLPKETFDEITNTPCEHLVKHLTSNISEERLLAEHRFKMKLKDKHELSNNATSN